MLAPNALKSDKGQNIDRGPDGSSSEFSEDDTPLAVRLNSQGNSRPNDTGKQRPRAALSKKGGFVIPRKKKQANGRNLDMTLCMEVEHATCGCKFVVNLAASIHYTPSSLHEQNLILSLT